MMLSNVEIPVMLSFEIDHSQPARKWRSVRELAANKCILMIHNWVLGFNNILQMVNHSQIEQEYAENFSKYLLEPKCCASISIFFHVWFYKFIHYLQGWPWSQPFYICTTCSATLPEVVSPRRAIYLQPIYYLWQGAPKRDHGGVCFGCTKSPLCQQEIH